MVKQTTGQVKLTPEARERFVELVAEARQLVYGEAGCPEGGTLFVEIEDDAKEVRHEFIRLMMQQATAGQAESLPDGERDPATGPTRRRSLSRSVRAARSRMLQRGRLAVGQQGLRQATGGPRLVAGLRRRAEEDVRRRRRDSQLGDLEAVLRTLGGCADFKFHPCVDVRVRHRDGRPRPRRRGSDFPSLDHLDLAGEGLGVIAELAARAVELGAPPPTRARPPLERSSRQR